MRKMSEMTQTEMVNHISKHEVFSMLPPKAYAQLKQIVNEVSVAKNKNLFSMGQEPNFIYYVVSGSLTIHFPDNTILEIEEGELIGEIGVLNGDFRLGTLTANKDSQLISICGTRLFNPSHVSTETSLQIVRTLGKRVTNYLRSIQQTSTQELISKGENDRIEFKSTLRWNLRAEKKDKAIVHAALKTIAAFLNTDGGILLVGVADDGAVLGLEKDKFENKDKLFLFLANTIKSQIGTLQLSNIHYHTEIISNQEVLRVDVHPSEEPCYISYENEERFYIRTGPSTNALKLSNVYEYIKKRFSN